MFEPAGTAGVDGDASSAEVGKPLAASASLTVSLIRLGQNIFVCYSRPHQLCDSCGHEEGADAGIGWDGIEWPERLVGETVNTRTKIGAERKRDQTRYSKHVYLGYIILSCIAFLCLILFLSCAIPFVFFLC